MKGRGWRLAARAAFAGALLLACGAPAPRTLVVDRSSSVTIYTGAARGQRPSAIDPEDPRVGVAQREIERLLGHGLGFELDAAVVAQFESDLHRAYVAALEETATALAGCQKNHFEAFEFGASACGWCAWRTARFGRSGR